MSGYQTIVVGTDGSETSLKAVDRAGQIARVGSATKLVIVCAYVPAEPRDVDRAQDILGEDAYQVVGSTPAEDTLRTAADRAKAAGAGNIETVAVRGEPVRVLMSASKKHRAELLVVGNRGLNTLAGRILGSVPSAVTHRAECDVLVVHTT
ncbi:universal stress protein [Fodinicola acaciae]|uniref:universal stress protein n=1 Tax=Fodinicola acaciae TaxID=2681555 RepID=UPI0013D3743D|nr:universal stress protein [Fodinicola acaciae]